ncbi:hypothetical protein VTI28DRAFT_8745 [Corynascus sepedonium]
MMRLSTPRRMTLAKCLQSKTMSKKLTGFKRHNHRDMPIRPQPKGRCRNKHLYANRPNDGVSLGFENNRETPDIRTLAKDEVEGDDFIFPYPGLGPGFFIVRCDSETLLHRFEEDPLRITGGRPFLVKHFSSTSKRCHRRDKNGPLPTVPDTIKTSGYRVIDYDGENVTHEWVEESNRRLAYRLKVAEERAIAAGNQGPPAQPEYGSAYRNGPPQAMSFTWSRSGDTGHGVLGPLRNEASETMAPAVSDDASSARQAQEN